MSLASKLSGFWDSRAFFIKILIVQSIFSTFVLLDIPVARQIFGFIDLMFVSGIAFFRLLRLDNLQRLEMILFSAGFSIALLIIAGVLLNVIAPLIGIQGPLTELPLVITLNSIVLASCFLSPYSRSGEPARARTQISGNLKFVVWATLVALFLSLPILSVLGTVWMNAYENNVILLLVIITVSMLMIVCIVGEKLLPSEFHPLAVTMIAVALLFQSSLISKYIVSGGSDILLEHSVFQATQKSGLWNPVLGQPLIYEEYERYNAMLSITILPTTFSNMLNVDTVLVFKIIFPMIFSLVPLALYQMWQTHVGKKAAFIAAFFFMAQQTFYTEMPGLARQMIAEFFFVLLFLVVLNAKITVFKKMTCFAIFSSALIVSHYAMSVIFLFIISLTWLALFAVRRPTSKITITMIALFFVLMFSWYIYTSNSATFDTILEFGDHVYNELDQWANPASRGSTVLMGLGMEPAPSIWNSISRGFAYITEFLVMAGFVGLVTRRVRAHFEREYFTFTLLTLVLLAALVLVPGLAETLNMTRFYHILLFFLAPLAVLGAECLVKLAFKRKTELMASILLMVVLIPYFLFQTNFVYEVTGSDSWSIPLSMYRTPELRLYVHDGYIDELSGSGAQWLSEKVENEHTEVYADISAGTTALSHFGILYSGRLTLLSNTTKVATNGIVYLNRFNLANGTMVTTYYLWNIFEAHTMEIMSKVYSNGGSEIYINLAGT